jgi:dTDP-glucose 4,6-dehydratase
VDGCTLNLGTGRGIQIGVLAEKIIRLTGSAAKVQLDPERVRPPDSEVLRLLSDNSLARERLGWAPVVSLEDGLCRTIEWVRGNLDHFRVGVYEL